LFLPLKLILHSFFTILFWFILFRVKYFFTLVEQIERVIWNL
jgi:hypothetical protein